MDLLKSQEAAQYLRVSERTLSALRSQNNGPRFHRLHSDGRGVRYRRADLDDWLNARGAA